VVPDTQEAISRRVVDKVGPRGEQTPYLKNKAKKGLGVAQVVETLPSKGETLGSNSSNTTKSKTKQKLPSVLIPFFHCRPQ
jgi:hypothetical protein